MLEDALTEINREARTIGIDETIENWGSELRELRGKVAEFQKALVEHTNWEEEKMFPMAAWYFGEEPEQFTNMEQEHEIAEQFLQAYVGAVERITQPVERVEAHDMASYLLQAYAVLKNHFRQEEEIIAALEDRSNTYSF